MINKNDDLWMVYDHEEGLVGLFDDIEEALKVYEHKKNSFKKYIDETFYVFEGDERIVLSKVIKQCYSYEDADKVTGITYWNFKEKKHKN
ncbi:hypothetical protein [Bacillus altitudinis]|uniref:hypothetical protein n=1 Tax=Bacillus altitudinis TaxID=293387 RepID=UPI0020407F37|nr:hypothetical protein [Bacillus altitudinis]MCM3045190.1 hypothetical protein [Bacillus altitudinis]MEC1801749.1 hypothetical protein [Bacillus altitudinis]